MADAAVTDTTTRSSADRRRYQVGWFRYPWVTIKLALVITVLRVGAFVIAPASSYIEQLSQVTDKAPYLEHARQVQELVESTRACG